MSEITERIRRIGDGPGECFRCGCGEPAEVEVRYVEWPTGGPSRVVGGCEWTAESCVEHAVAVWEMYWTGPYHVVGFRPLAGVTR